jgi:DNA-binding NarL/FixJ family response regulator
VQLGRRGTPVLSRSPVDLVILDYEPHHGIGTDLLRDLRSRGEEVRVLVVTGGISDAVTLEVLAAGAAGVIYKQAVLLGCSTPSAEYRWETFGWTIRPCGP